MGQPQVTPPPKPDPDGNPRPPDVHARFRYGLKRESTFTGVNPRDGRSKTLEEYRVSAASRRQSAVWLVVLAYGVTALVLQDFLWFTRSWGEVVILAVVVVLAICAVFVKSTFTVSAGADWLQHQKRWVNTYELTRIKVSPSAETSTYLDLRDSSGRKLSIRLPLLQENQKLWNLVYNGMAHSVAYGSAEIKGLNYNKFLNLDRFRPVRTNQDGQGPAAR